MTVAVLPMLMLASCGPKMDVSHVAGRLITIRNNDSSSFTITRITVNGKPGVPDCNDQPNATLAPGKSYSTTFILCGYAEKIRVETDRGVSSVETAAGS